MKRRGMACAATVCHSTVAVRWQVHAQLDDPLKPVVLAAVMVRAHSKFFVAQQASHAAIRPLPPGRRAATAHAAELFAALRQDTLFRIVLCFRGLGCAVTLIALLYCGCSRSAQPWCSAWCVCRASGSGLVAKCLRTRMTMASTSSSGTTRRSEGRYGMVVWYRVVWYGVVRCGTVLYGMSTHCEYPQYRDETRLDETRLNPKPTAATRGLWAI